MAIAQFENLSEQEVELLVNAPAYVTVLIAAADDKIDRKEKGWATKLVKYRTFTSNAELHEYYKVVNASFETALNSLVELYHEGKDAGGSSVGAELTKLNDILPKLDPSYASTLLASWKSLAEKVAEASGGLLGYASIDTEERALVDLPMISFS